MMLILTIAAGVALGIFTVWGLVYFWREALIVAGVVLGVFVVLVGGLIMYHTTTPEEVLDALPYVGLIGGMLAIYLAYYVLMERVIFPFFGRCFRKLRG